MEWGREGIIGACEYMFVAKRESRSIYLIHFLIHGSPTHGITIPSSCQVFSTPPTARRLKPFIDHVLTFSLTSDNRIWFRNYQIVEKDPENPNATKGKKGGGSRWHGMSWIGLELHARARQMEFDG